MDPWLNVVLVGAVIVVLSLLMPKNKPESDQSTQTVRNMETALDEFMENMEKDNEQLLQLVAETQKNSKQEAEQKDQRISLLEQRCGQLEKLLQEAIVKPAIAASSQQQNSQAAMMAAAVSERTMTSTQLTRHEAAAEQESTSSSSNTLKPDSIQARYAELFQLYAEGKSVEAIAKRLGMNKGEVQLIIGLSKQEEAAHV